jgi:hypothetical protein
MTGRSELRVLGRVAIVRAGSELAVNTQIPYYAMSVQFNLGTLYGRQRRYAEAIDATEPVLRDVLERYERLGDPQAEKVRAQLHELE